jgi:N-acetylglutamate synthase-like GNAT family acetyltransferase
MRFLLDTNIFIPLEPVESSDMEVGSIPATSFQELCRRNRLSCWVHPNIEREIKRDRDKKRASVRLLRVRAYPFLSDPPGLTDEIVSKFGDPDHESHDYLDLLLLSALVRDTVDYLVTDDRGIHKKGKKLNVSERILTLSDALALIRHHFPEREIPALPGVALRKVHILNASDPVFDTLKQDYPEFEDWLGKCRKESRECFVIGDPDKSIIGVCIFKEEKNDIPMECSGKTLKISTFKIAERYVGYKYGELLLKTILQYARINGFHSLFLTAKPDKEHFLNFIEEFGFYQSQNSDNNGDLVFVKDLFPPANVSLNPLDFIILFGPGIESHENVSIYLVPIQPEYHNLLFPDSNPSLQGDLFPASFPFQNTIRKAYLSQSGIRTLQPGDVLLFYRSKDLRSIGKIGVLEKILVNGRITHHPGNSFPRIEESR